MLNKKVDLFGVIGFMCVLLAFTVQFLFAVPAIILGCIGACKKDTVHWLSYVSIILGFIELLIVAIHLC